jgi:adenylate cyclase
MSSDLEQDYFCDGLTEEIITALSRFKALFVIARNSSFTYKSKAVDVRQIGRELGVRYVLEGSVRKLGHRVRITGQLIESATGTHIWAERYDGNLDDVFSLQDEITASVVAAVEPTVTAAEIARAKQKKTENLNAYDLYLRAMADTYDLRAATYERAEGLLRSAIEQDSNYSDALAALADCLARAALNGWKDFAPAVQEASEFARRSILAEPDNGRALAIAAWIYANLQGRHKEARELAERALRSHPNSSMVRALTGWALLYCGKIEAAMELFVASQRMNPVDPLVRIATNGIGAAHFFAREFQESVEWNERVLQTTPGSTVAMRYLAAALAHLGRVSEAKEIIARLLRSQPNSSLSRSRQSAFEHQWMLDLYLDGLRRAGLPE